MKISINARRNGAEIAWNHTVILYILRPSIALTAMLDTDPETVEKINSNVKLPFWIRKRSKKNGKQKYANKIDLDSLPDQPRPEAYEI